MAWVHGAGSHNSGTMVENADELKPDFEEQAKTFVDGLVDSVLHPVAEGRRAQEGWENVA